VESPAFLKASIVLLYPTKSFNNKISHQKKKKKNQVMLGGGGACL
jgi:hypothetical protein